MATLSVLRTAVRNRVVFLILASLLMPLLLSACAGQDCPAGLHAYKDKCLTNMAIQYVGCTEGRGMDVTTEISAGVGGTFKVVADASLDIALKRAQKENTPVALEIVKACLEIAKTTSPPDDPEQGALKAFQDEQILATPKLTISPASAREGAQVTLTGSRFWPTEMVDIYLHASLLTQVQADASGGFTTAITVPSSAPPPGFPSTITATGQTSAKSAQAPFQTAP
jgi:hypothetical protein